MSATQLPCCRFLPSKWGSDQHMCEYRYTISNSRTELKLRTVSSSLKILMSIWTTVLNLTCKAVTDDTGGGCIPRTSLQRDEFLEERDVLFLQDVELYFIVISSSKLVLWAWFALADSSRYKNILRDKKMKENGNRNIFFEFCPYASRVTARKSQQNCQKKENSSICPSRFNKQMAP